jgi:nucleotide-binding universal stress UspA family protein
MTMTILAVLTDPRTARAVLEAASGVAAIDPAAAIEALHVRVDRETLIMPTEEVMTKQRRAELDAMLAERARLLQDAFTVWSKTSGGAASRATWHEVAGVVAAEVAARGKLADLLVLARPLEDEGHAALDAAIFATGRLFLLVPPDFAQPAIGRHMAIAWKASDTASRAIVASLPWLRQAARISVLVTASGCAAQAAQARALLATHGIADAAVAVETIADGRDESVGAALLAAAHSLGADSLVLGAYRRHRFFEWVLGGVTHHVLRHAGIPAFMLH